MDKSIYYIDLRDIETNTILKNKAFETEIKWKLPILQSVFMVQEIYHSVILFVILSLREQMFI